MDFFFCPSRRDIKHCMLSASESCEKIFTGDSGGIRTHDLLLTSADVLTTRPPSLPMASGRFEPRIAAGTAIDINFDGILNIFSQDSESTEHTVLNITSGRAKIHHCDIHSPTQDSIKIYKNWFVKNSLNFHQYTQFLFLFAPFKVI